MANLPELKLPECKHTLMTRTQWVESVQLPELECTFCKVERLERELVEAKADFKAAKLCTRCGSKYDGTGTCTNKPCQGGIGEWCIEHHGAPFGYSWRERLTLSEARRKELEAFAAKVDGIRNAIIGSQSVNWSRDIYPLVSALKEIGLEGLGYEKARAALATDGDDK